MTIQERIKQKTEQLEKLGKTIVQLQKALQENQVEALKLDGAINQLKEIEQEESKGDVIEDD